MQRPFCTVASFGVMKRHKVSSGCTMVNWEFAGGYPVPAQLPGELLPTLLRGASCCADSETWPLKRSQSRVETTFKQ